MNFPLVSIVIPSYKPEFFEQTLRSAIGQTYPNIEIIISDNCPREDIRHICEKFNNVHYSRNPDIGAGNVLKTLYEGSGTYIKPLFDDDILHPFCVEKMVKAIQANSSIELVFSASAVIDNANNKTSVRKPNNGSALISGKDIQRQMALSFINIIGEFSSILYSRKAIEQYAPSDLFKFGSKDYSYGLADVVAFLNLIRGKNLYYYDEELTYFRLDNNLQSNSNPSANKNFVHCVTDWIDFLLESYDTEIITLDELKNCHKLVSGFTARWDQIFPVMREFKNKYEHKIQFPK